MAKRALKAGDKVSVRGVAGRSTLVERVEGQGWYIRDNDGVVRAVREDRIT